MNLRPQDTLFSGEAFSVKTSSGRNWDNSVLTGCWGSFTKHYHNVHSTVAFTMYFNTHSPSTSLQEISDKHVHSTDRSDKRALILWNYDIVMSVEDIRKEFAYLKQHLKKYVDYRYYTKFNSKERRWYGAGSTNVQTNSELTLVFTNQPMYKIFLIANMYRTFLSMRSREAYFAAKNLTKSRWHKLSFVNIMLLLDLLTNKSSDSCIGQALIIYNCTNWLNAKIFKSFNAGIAGFLCFKIIRSTVKRSEREYYRRDNFNRYFKPIFGIKNADQPITPTEQMNCIENVYTKVMSMFKEAKLN